MNARATLLKFVVTGLLLFCTAPAVAADAGRSHAGDSSQPRQHSERIKGFKPFTASMHLHTHFSNGEYSVAELAGRAQGSGIDILGFSDSLISTARYGLPPFRKLLSRRVARKSVLDHGVEAYLRDIDSAQKKFPSVLLLAGVEVTPSYAWRGTIGQGLKLFFFDRHLQVYGLENVAGIENLPVIENEAWQNTSKDWRLLLFPFLALGVGTLLLLLKFERRIWLSHFTVRKHRRFRVLGLGLTVLGLLSLYDAYPFGRLADPYSGKDDLVPYQRLVDYVRQRNGLVFWSYPEARFKELRIAGANMVSSPHPEDLWRVERYHGFEGLYGDRITVTLPGNAWDRLLVEYCRGGRDTWPSAISGIDFHYFKKSAWYTLDRGQTVLWCRSRERKEVLEALRLGRGYSVFQNDPGRDLRLNDFSVSSEAGIAIAGELVESSGKVSLRGTIDWTKNEMRDSAELATLEIIRNGVLVDLQTVPFPVSFDRTETLQPGRHYYRVRLRCKESEVLSNPIFCDVRARR